MAVEVSQGRREGKRTREVAINDQAMNECADANGNAGCKMQMPDGARCKRLARHALTITSTMYRAIC